MKPSTFSHRYYQFCCAVILLSACGFLGWLYETVLTSILWGRFVGFQARGMLHIPICPIYGFGAFLMLPIFRKHNGRFTVFFGGMLLCTLLELLSSYLISLFLHTQLWSYADWDFNFQGRISLYSSLIFGVLSVLLIKVVYPLIKKLLLHQNKRITILIGSLFAVTLLFDLTLTVMQEFV